eukprot:TRINITY_DN4704_c0_g1_i5.p1 TRINITY_DN4704_c0_g1~~TRINITY_DN4704_c0_g1_i5.p1  ORF type:complete len:406 (+),score=153.18 TRINITY_DN4704_c0_g1_i5:165-1220(+)
MDVLIIQDGGCSPGYNVVTAYLSQYFEKAGMSVSVAMTGFQSVVRGGERDFGALIWERSVYETVSLVPNVMFAPDFVHKRGASFRTERYPEFKQVAIQQQAAANIQARGVKILVTIGGNGTFFGTKALCRWLPPSVQVFFAPCTIDSDIQGTECIGQHTAVEMGAEKIRCFIADASTHHRCYIIEMMGRDGGYHALHSCLGAGAELAVMPNSSVNLPKLAQLINERKHTVIVVAEGYAREERKNENYDGSASSFLHKQLKATGVLNEQQRRVVSEPFSRDIRGASVNNMDMVLSQKMAKRIVEMATQGLSHRMPTVKSDEVSSIQFDEIDTNNTVRSDEVALADRLDVLIN